MFLFDIRVGTSQLQTQTDDNTQDISEIKADRSLNEMRYTRKEAVINQIDPTAAPPPATVGDRYVLGFDVGSVDVGWDGAAKGDIVQYDGSSWIAQTPAEGWVVYSDGQNAELLFVDDGTPTWIIKTSNATPVRNNYVLVKQKSDFPAAIGGIITLTNNTSYEINGEINLGTDRIALGDSNIIYGQDKSDDKLVYTGLASSMITSVNKNFSLRKLTLTASGVGGQVLNCSGDGSNRTEIAECVFVGCNQIGSITGGYTTITFRNNLCIANANGLFVTGVNDDMFVTDNLFESFAGPGTALSIQGTVSYHTILIDRNMWEIAPTQTALDIDPNITFTGGGFITNNSFEDGGTYLKGINANSSSWKIPSKSNIGIAGLFRTNRTIVLGTFSTTTSGVWVSVTQQVLTRQTIIDYEENATTLRGSLTVGITHDVALGDVGYRLFNLTDGVVVPGSEVSSHIITTGGVFEVLTTSEFNLLPGKEYRVQVRKNSGVGSNAVIVNGGDLTIKAF